MQKSTTALVAVTATLATTPALAHTGHDHSAHMSMLSHVLFYGSIVASVALVAFIAVQYVKKTK